MQKNQENWGKLNQVRSDQILKIDVGKRGK